jgi:large subunit ribosomal protein L7A
MLEALKNPTNRVVGTKQLLRALEGGKVAQVFVAEDADEFIYRRVRTAAEQSRVPVTVVKTMAQLGQACHIDVGTAAAGLLR